MGKNFGTGRRCPEDARAAMTRPAMVRIDALRCFIEFL